MTYTQFTFGITNIVDFKFQNENSIFENKIIINVLLKHFYHTVFGNYTMYPLPIVGDNTVTHN